MPLKQLLTCYINGINRFPDLKVFPLSSLLISVIESLERSALGELQNDILEYSKHPITAPLLRGG